MSLGQLLWNTTNSNGCQIFGVIHCLTDLSAQSSLQERMDSLASGMGECAHLANAIWNETKTWRDMVAELEQATNSEYGEYSNSHSPQCSE